MHGSEENATATLYECALRLQHGDCAKSVEKKVEAFVTCLETDFTANNFDSVMAPVTIDDVVRTPIKF